MSLALGLVIIPLLAALLMLLWPRLARGLQLAAALLCTILATMLLQLVQQEGSQQLFIGGWNPLLAIRWQADSVTALLLLLSAVLHLLVSGYALAVQQRDKLAAAFWPLSSLLLASLQALWLSRDLFNLYVCLELLGMVAVALVTLSGDKAMRPALHYLLFSLFASLCYLLGVALLYGAYGALDLPLLQGQLQANSLTAAALVLITLGLMLKAAWWPLHLWLPAAHAAAPAPVSALLSALVVKGPLFILVLVWTTLAPAAFLNVAAYAFLVCALGALLLAGVAALRTPYSKTLVAYSTVAQLGYAMLALALMLSFNLPVFTAALWLFVMAHALAKAACFLSIGEMQQTLGVKKVAQLKGASQTMPLAMFAFAVAGGSLIGLPPSGGFLAKWVMLLGLWQAQQYFLLLVLLVATLVSAAYIFRVVVLAFDRAEPTAPDFSPQLLPQWLALLPALAVWAMAFFSMPLLAILQQELS
ncbi:cation:proton antiporter [Alishewanella longhuensis]|uniref:Cation:proton antiporter n=1 Tax=Alishewanella longhuensis TaxID=1091037 RepID=A0ABQ3L1T5_9ALTE|nr:proton-conducting transporter membrane subunit [Alishewanella longhuensis]GHG67730.1 cation:proton antiporter [Alishewanella longhuensis]